MANKTNCDKIILVLEVGKQVRGLYGHSISGSAQQRYMEKQDESLLTQCTLLGYPHCSALRNGSGYFFKYYLSSMIPNHSGLSKIQSTVKFLNITCYFVAFCPWKKPLNLFPLKHVSIQGHQRVASLLIIYFLITPSHPSSLSVIYYAD